ncbi:hypothetical protein HDU97_007943 [Phlyctochytrium planicorne]|nr:hypothetical protein HDU97_007943 [Phlyctochytrium planicorne]
MPQRDKDQPSPPSKESLRLIAATKADASIRFLKLEDLSEVTYDGVWVLFFGDKGCKFTQEFTPIWLQIQKDFDKLQRSGANSTIAMESSSVKEEKEQGLKEGLEKISDSKSSAEYEAAKRGSSKKDDVEKKNKDTQKSSKDGSEKDEVRIVAASKMDDIKKNDASKESRSRNQRRNPHPAKMSPTPRRVRIAKVFCSGSFDDYSFCAMRHRVERFPTINVYVKGMYERSISERDHDGVLEKLKDIWIEFGQMPPEDDDKKEAKNKQEIKTAGVKSSSNDDEAKVEAGNETSDSAQTESKPGSKVEVQSKPESINADSSHSDSSKADLSKSESTKDTKKDAPKIGNDKKPSKESKPQVLAFTK